MTTARPAPGATPARRVIVIVTIASFSVAALLGVLALLGGGEFGETQVQVLLTTLVVGVVSVAVLCYLATAGTSYQVVGAFGGLAAMVPLATSLLMIWGGDDRFADGLVEAFGVGTIAAATLAQVCLLLVLVAGRGPGLRVLLALTLLLATLLAAILSALVLGADADDDATARLIGVIAILDVLGTVVVAALAKFGPDERGDRGRASVAVPPDLLDAVDRRAAEQGRTRQQVVEDALRSHIGSPTS